MGWGGNRRGQPARLTIPGPFMSQSANVTTQFAAGVASGAIRVVDLTQELSPDTPTLVLPPNFAQCSGFKVEEISRYDERGAA